MSRLRRELADLAGRIQAMKVAVEAIDRHLEDAERTLLRLMAEHDGEEPAPPGQRGS